MTSAFNSEVEPHLTDTCVLSYLTVRSGPTREHWATLTQGLLLVISAQTRAEILALPLINNWGQKRRRELHNWLQVFPVVPLDEAVQDEYSRVYAWGIKQGHAIGHKAQTADRWVAATSLAHDLPLITNDSDFDGIPDLRRFPVSLED